MQHFMYCIAAAMGEVMYIAQLKGLEHSLISPFMFTWAQEVKKIPNSNDVSAHIWSKTYM